MGFFDFIGKITHTIGSDLSRIAKPFVSGGKSIYNHVLKPVYNKVVKPVYNKVVAPVVNTVSRVPSKVLSTGEHVVDGGL
jgi:hypothetical protein